MEGYRASDQGRTLRETRNLLGSDWLLVWWTLTEAWI